MVFLSPPGDFRDSTLNLRHDRFLPNNFRLVFHVPPFYSTLYIFIATKKTLNELQLHVVCFVVIFVGLHASIFLSCRCKALYEMCYCSCDDTRSACISSCMLFVCSYHALRTSTASSCLKFRALVLSTYSRK